MAEGSDDAYEVTPMRCFACAAKERAGEGFENRAGLYFILKRTKEVGERG